MKSKYSYAAIVVISLLVGGTRPVLGSKLIPSDLSISTWDTVNGIYNLTSSFNCSPNIYVQSDEYEETPDVEVIYQFKALDLPGLQLPNPDISFWDGQVIYLDFDGEQDVTYNGPVTVGPFDVPAFKVPDELERQRRNRLLQSRTRRWKI